MFRLDGSVLYIELPMGKSQEQLVRMAEEEIEQIIRSGKVFGKDIKLNGRLTTGMSLMLGHKLAHVCRSVSIFDPKEGKYIRCISH